MKFPSAEFDDAVSAACHGTADESLLEALGGLLVENDAALDAYVRRTELHAALLTTPQFVLPVDLAEIDPAGALCDGVGERRSAAWAPAGNAGWVIAGGALLLGLAALWLAGGNRSFTQGAPVARPAASLGHVVGVFADLQTVVWVAADTDIKPGDPVRAGDRIELADGSLRIEFGNGAAVRLAGPAIFEIESPLVAVLTLGCVTVTADTPGSKGFTVRTRTGSIVDLGTEFIAEALPDGRCRVGVTAGAVRFHPAANAGGDGHLLEAGDLLEVEPGRRQVLTRIERGDESPAFAFPTIESPSADDCADASHGRAQVRHVRGRLYENPRKGIASAAPQVLLDGRGQSGPDNPAESLYFLDGDTGAIVVDLGSTVAVKKINVFSWHLCRNPGFPADLRVAHRERAAQNYVIYGSSATEAPAVGDDPAAAGWTLIARVDSDQYFGLTGGKRPAQQASSIASARGSLGSFRHLLFVVQPTTGINHDGRELDFGTFFGEIDVYSN